MGARLWLEVDSGGDTDGGGWTMTLTVTVTATVVKDVEHLKRPLVHKALTVCAAAQGAWCMLTCACGVFVLCHCNEVAWFAVA